MTIQPMTESEAAPGDISDYLHEIAEYPLLTADEEIQLARQLADGRCAARRIAAAPAPADREKLEQQARAGALARRRLIESNLRLVVSVARRYSGRGLSLQDLIQEGNIGLQTGIEKYEWRKGYRLSTYIYWWIRQAITRALANDSRTIRLPVHAGELLRRASQTKQQLQAELGHEPTEAQIAARVGIHPERLQAIRRVAATPGSLDMPLGEESTSTRADTLVDEAATYPLELVGEAADLERSVDAVVEELPERERYVLKLHYGLGRTAALTLAEIGKQMGISRERARQIESQAFRRLRGDMRVRHAFVEMATG
jgi:RNA polymerase primary sigma factor